MAEPNISIGAVVQAATLAGQTEKARSIVENVAHLYRHFQDPTNQPDVYKDGLRDQMNKRLGLCHAPNIWKYLKEANIGEVLRIDSRSVDNYVAEGCRLIEKRFTEGPDRPYSDHSIEDLVHMLDEAKKSQSFPSSDEEDVASNMQNPATEEDITELETRLGREPRLSNYQNAQAYATQIEPDATPLLPEDSLPQDYRDFLRVINGFYLHGPDDQGCLFYGTEGIDASDDQLGIHDLDFLLFPYNMTSLSGDEIEMGEFRGFSIGACGDEGQALLIPRSSIEPTLKWFERVYAQADTRRKREYERGALDIYGGIDQLRSIEWLCIESFHWDPETTIFNGFRQYLEYCVERAVNKADRLHEREEEKAEQERRA
ncbi:hypothetical protein N0V95_004502 [Ascochyta clinopodiicola]|nr:hypothetical protein N0V95_004502 [Ascochyta clinopodiicola]